MSAVAERSIELPYESLMGLAKPKQHHPRLRRQNDATISVREQVLADFGAFQQSGHWNPNPSGKLGDERDRRLYTQLLQGLARHHRLLETVVQERLHHGIQLKPEIAAVLNPLWFPATTTPEDRETLPVADWMLLSTGTFVSSSVSVCIP